MLYYFIYKSLPDNMKEKPRDYDLEKHYSRLRVEFVSNSFLCYYFDQWDQWDE